MQSSHGVSEIHDGEDLWQWSRLELGLHAFPRLTIPQNSSSSSSSLSSSSSSSSSSETFLEYKEYNEAKNCKLIRPYVRGKSKNIFDLNRKNLDL